MKKHLIIASYDGISTHYCGIGTTMQDTIAAIKDISKGSDFKVSLAYINPNPKGDIYDLEKLQNSLKLVKETGGHLIPLCNGTEGITEYDMWQSFPQWHYINASLATALNLILTEDEEVVIMLHDTPFLLFHKFKQQIFNKKISCYYMPRSSGSNHKFGDELWRLERIELEKEAFAAISADDNSYILSIGYNFGKHLYSDYGLTFKEDQYLINGLYFGRYEDYYSREFTVEDLKKFGINLSPESKIIFSWGRASTAKGFKEMLEAWQKIVDQLPNHHLILQAPNNSGEDSYFRILRDLEKNIPRTVVINDFNPAIWQTILRIQNTDIVCVPSTMDPIPHTAIEAKLFANDMNYVVVGSNADGVKDIFTDSECVWVSPHNIDDFASGIIVASQKTGRERQIMNTSNADTLDKFNYLKTINKFLSSIDFI